MSSDRLDFSKLSKARRTQQGKKTGDSEHIATDGVDQTTDSTQGTPHTPESRPRSSAEGSQGRSIPRLNFNKLREPATNDQSTPDDKHPTDSAHRGQDTPVPGSEQIVEQSSDRGKSAAGTAQGGSQRAQQRPQQGMRPTPEQGTQRSSGDSPQGKDGDSTQGKSHTLGDSQTTKRTPHDGEQPATPPDQSTQTKSHQGGTTHDQSALNRQEQTSRTSPSAAHHQQNRAKNGVAKGGTNLPKTENHGTATENADRGGGPTQGKSHTFSSPQQDSNQGADRVQAGTQGHGAPGGEGPSQGENTFTDPGYVAAYDDDSSEYIDASLVEEDGEHDNAAEDDSAPFTGFDSMFEDLLSDDEDEFVEQVRTPRQGAGRTRGNTPQGDTDSVETGADTVFDEDATGIVNPFIDDHDDETDESSQGVGHSVDDALDEENPYLDAVVERAGKRNRARDQFPEEYEKREATKAQNNPKRDAGYEKFQQDVAEWEAEQGVERREAPEHTTVHRQFARNYDQYPVSEVVVNDQGVPQDYAERVEQSAPKHTKFKYFSKDKKMNTAEMAFFRATRERKSAALKSIELAERLLPPIGKQETEKDFRARARRITRALEGKDAYKKGARATFGLKEQDTLRFLAMFRYATPSHISRMFSEPRPTTVNRLNKLRSHGLIINRAIFGTEDLWVLTDAGMLLSGLELVRTTDARMTFSMFPHQFTVNNTAAHLWGAGVNVLGDEEYPRYNKTNLRGEPIPGEQLVSELEIQSTFTKQRAFGAAHIFRPQIIGQIDTAFDKWEDAGGVEFGQSPEMHQGNEYMWTLLPPTVHRHAYHVPDLVVKRDRNPDGSPNSLAVEIEIYNKPQESYDRTLRAYAADTRLYKQVVWVCKGVGSAKKLEKAAKKTGLLQEDRIRIVPILTEDGVFKGRDLWLI